MNVLLIISLIASLLVFLYFCIKEDNKRFAAAREREEARNKALISIANSLSLIASDKN